ncbi:MAG TPA: bifunctional phosphopantothenoylcysteine decarboxylase/phosphopantothenate--cysteine ligase CoaBC [Chitinophagaceae bacterium]|nr:bifunctional phosphopantothenoylcysteine decarboxylase/phosphopantothenate--cysteine ligase CoaBC [Chitinophagaceae bacterium]
MKGRKILLGISGSIAAYKIPMLVRLLVKAGAEVRVVMTQASTGFVSPLVLQTLSRNEVLCEIQSENEWANHVALGRWADVFLIAPASCNTLAKMAHGLCDNLLLSVYLSATCPVMIAPAMDEDMWLHPATRSNLQLLSSFGHTIIPSEYGELASGLTGMGRMAEPETLFVHLQNFLHSRQDLLGKKALVTAGPTYENIDPVRFIGNYSSGKMGIAIAEALAERGCEVELVLGPSSENTYHPGIHIIRVQNAEQMYEKSMEHFPHCQLAVLSAAVADYTPVTSAHQKIKKTGDHLQIELKKTKDILRTLGEVKKAGQYLVGFALETQNEREYALHKLESKNADLIVMNSLRDEGAAFGHDTNQVTLFTRKGEQKLELQSKKQIARSIVSFILQQIKA